MLDSSFGSADTPFWKALRELGLPVHLIRDRFACDPSLVGQFKRVAQTIRPDVVQTHGYRPNTLGRLAKSGFAVPWIAFFHGYTWENWKICAYNRIDLWAMSRADVVTTVAQSQAEYLRLRLPRSSNLCVIPNAVLLKPVARDESLRPQLLAEEHDFLVGVFGRVTLFLLIRGYIIPAALERGHSNVRFRINHLSYPCELFVLHLATTESIE